ncbi:MAG: DNA polymerase domain-containing protein [Flexilinea sp.]
MELSGWIIDIYEDKTDGVRIWFLTDTDERICLRQPFPVTFYAYGTQEQLHRACLLIKNDVGLMRLCKAVKKDVFRPDPICVLQIDADNPVHQREIFIKLKNKYPELTYYDADISVNICHAARYQTFPLAFCKVTYDRNDNQITTLQVLNNRWNIHPLMPHLRIIEIKPNEDPNRKEPSVISVKYKNRMEYLALHDKYLFMEQINELIASIDPDIVLTEWGDTWFFPLLQQYETYTNIPAAFNRDKERIIKWKKEITYFSYGQIIYRGKEAYLYGRCHVDIRNAIMWRDYGLPGTLESSRVTSLPIQQTARVSPGAGISAMQMITAIEHDILVPEQKQQIETEKNALDLIHADRGGLVYQPKTGLHCNVAQIDFASMYPAVIINCNISPEVPLPKGLMPANTELGVVPLTLKPLYDKRVEIKRELLRTTGRELETAANYKARASALKWLLVVCFGFLGYKNARFGKIEAHEAVTNGGREALLIAKEVCENYGFEVLHLFVDALWIKQPGFCSIADFQDVLNEISRQTKMMISLDGIYRWIAFLPSRNNDAQPVPNRYFGVFQDGSLKIRGIEARRRDTPQWVVDTQIKMLNCLAKAYDVRQLPDYLPKAFRIYKKALDDLNTNKVEPEMLVITNRISKDLEQYKTPTAAVRAASQLLERTGKRTVPGQKIRYLYTKDDVYAWDQPGEINWNNINKAYYRELLTRAAGTVLFPFGIKQKQLSDFAQGGLQFELKEDASCY